MAQLLELASGLWLRRLTPDDIDHASQLAGRAFQSQETAELVNQMLQIHCESGAYQVPLEDQSQTLLAVSYYVLTRSEPPAETLLGLTGLYRPSWADKQVYWLAWFAIDPVVHGQGFGTELLKATCAVARAKGGRLLCVETSHTLEPAMHLYRKTGFREYGNIPDYWRPGESLIVLARHLQDASILSTEIKNEVP